MRAKPAAFGDQDEAAADEFVRGEPSDVGAVEDDPAGALGDQAGEPH
jgi:hypothetical protein